VHTEQMNDPVFDVPRSIPIPDPVRKGVEGIGKILRRIFRF